MGVAGGISTDGTQSGFTIQNDIIEGEFVGVALNSPTTGTVLASAVSNNQFENNGTAIASTLGLENAKINGNTFSGDTTWSVEVNGPAASNVQIVNNQFTGDAPILLVNADSSEIDNNTITNPIGNAIDLWGGVTNSDITNNTISVSPAGYSKGIFADSILSNAANSGNRFANNSISGLETGIELITATDNTISGNTITDCDTGIELLSSDATIKNNTVSDYSDDGIEVLGGDATITVTGNTANGDGEAGIEILTSSDVTLNNNTANGSEIDAHTEGDLTVIGNTADNGVGINLSGDTVIVRNNESNGGTFYGLTVFGTTDHRDRQHSQ